MKTRRQKLNAAQRPGYRSVLLRNVRRCPDCPGRPLVSMPCVACAARSYNAARKLDAKSIQAVS